MNGQGTYHVCVTHSPLVSRVFAATASVLSLPEDKTCYISRRGTRIPETGACLDLVSDEMERCYKNFDRSGYRRAWKNLEDILLGLTDGQPFEAYIPHETRSYTKRSSVIEIVLDILF